MSRTLRCALILSALLTATAPSAARAETGELALSLGAGTWVGSATVGDSEIVTTAPTGVVALRYGLDDFWQIGASVAAGVGLSADHDPGFLGLAHLEAYYFVDIITWVLWGVAGVGVLARDAHPDVLAGTASAPALDLTAAVGLGLDYRPDRDWSVGGVFRYTFVLTDLDRTAPSAHLALCWTWYFE